MPVISRLLRCFAICVMFSAVSTAYAQVGDSFYTGRTITIVVGSTAGGYYDIGARIVARHIGKYIPGNPGVAVQNLPSASGLAVGNRLANTVERDGSTIFAVNRAVPQLALIGDPNVAFDPLDLTWLGSLSSYRNDGYLLVINARHPVRTLDDAKAASKPINLGGTRAGATNIVFGLIAKDLLKLNVELIRGFPGAAEIFLAMDREELDGQVIDLSAILVGRRNLWLDGQLRPLVVFGRANRMPEYPDVPTGRELITDPADAALLEFAELPFFMAFPFAAPPGIPPDRARMLKDGFMAMTRDPSFQDDIRKSGILLSAIDGEAVRALIAQASRTPSDVRARFAKLMTDK
jgi:tripartite-type tricarboxylate transporter receptor subunit TctC